VRSIGTAVTGRPDAIFPSVVSVTAVWSSNTVVTLLLTLDL
ncbi:hypothetical protein A2U01_0075206, partial [Trifolium medium]|nr:hypothetical protein [Trifolium medium]